MSSYRECGRCGARIVWAQTVAGRRQPLDWQPDPQGIVLAYQDEHQQWHSRAWVAGEPVEMPWKRYTAHFATCTSKPAGDEPDRPRLVAVQADARDELAEARARRAAEQRDTWRNEIARHNAAGRTRRGRWRRAAQITGFRIPPPGGRRPS